MPILPKSNLREILLVAKKERVGKKEIVERVSDLSGDREKEK